MKKKALIIAAIALTSLAFTTSEYFDIARNLDIFATLFKEVNTLYVDEVDPGKLVRTGLEAMVNSLDPYTVYMSEAEAEEFRVLATGQYAGIGTLVGRIRNKIYITQPYQGFPAQRSGLQVGDQILAINGTSTKDLTISEVSALLKGQPDSEVRLAIMRGDQELSFQLRREKIAIHNVVYAGLVNPTTGYIRLDEFTPGAGREVQEAVIQLRKQGATGLILDLRNNPGGILYEGINVVNLFVPKGSNVVETKGKMKEWNKRYATLNNPVDLEIPLVVLVGNESASAAEIVAGSLQDYDRAVLLGERTFGKGLVQTTRPIPYNSQLKITAARYYIPSGRCIQALNYASRDKDGHAIRTADSLRTAFKTTRGRTVYDGGGIEPDKLSPAPAYSALVEALFTTDLPFLFMVQYHARNPVPPANFEISEPLFQEFVQFVIRNNFTFTGSLETELTTLQQEIRKENPGKELESLVNQMQADLKKTDRDELEQHKAAIKELLSAEMAFHYGLYEGESKLAMQRDKAIRSAVELLARPEEYKSILKIN